MERYQDVISQNLLFQEGKVLCYSHPQGPAKQYFQKQEAFVYENRVTLKTSELSMILLLNSD
jgi:hypothetical protein